MRKSFTSALAATIGAATLALAAAGVADAKPPKPYKDPATGKYYCYVQNSEGGYTAHPDGSEMTINDSDGRKVTYRCNDGKWEQTIVRPGLPRPTCTTLRLWKPCNTARLVGDSRLGIVSPNM